jgi:hypothetical protein
MVRKLLSFVKATEDKRVVRGELRDIQARDTEYLLFSDSQGIDKICVKVMGLIDVVNGP